MMWLSRLLFKHGLQPLAGMRGRCVVTVTLLLATSLSASANPWSPTNITTAAWFDAADSATVQVSGSFVTNWNDKSGNGYDAVQGTASAQPTTGSTIGSLNAISFDGSADYLQTLSNPFGVTINDAFIIMVMNSGVHGGSTTFSLSGVAANRWQSHAPWSDGRVYFDTGGSGGDNRLSYVSGWSASTPHLIGFYCSTTDNVQEVWEGGASKASDATGHAVSTSGGLTLGSAGASSYDNCLYGEVIIIDGTVSDYTREKLEGYLAHKWGLEGSLPGGHPFKASAPELMAPNAVASGVSPADSATDVLRTPGTLSWDAPAEDATHDPATGYNVYFGQNATVTANPLYNTSSVSLDISSLHPLDASTVYYWRVDATNIAGSTAGTTWSFTTSDGRPIVDNLGPDATSLSTATLYGEVTSTNGTVLDHVRIYFGTSDGGTTPDNWDMTNVFDVSTITEGVAFSTNISGLLYGVDYYYVVYASNSVMEVWSSVTNFTTPLAWGGTLSLQHEAVEQLYDNGGTFDLSVYPGKAEYDGNGFSGTFGDGTVSDYRFFNAPGGVFNGTGYANGGGGLVGVASCPDANTDSGTVNWADVWTSNDPGTGFSGGDAANFTSSTLARGANVTGDIDISGMAAGVLYFIYGSYANPNTISLTMSGSGQPNQNASNTEDPPGENHGWISRFRFTGAGDYDTISYTYSNTDSDGSRARFMGAIIDSSLVALNVSVSNTVATNITSSDFDLEGILNVTHSVFTVYAYCSVSNNTTAQAWLDDTTAFTTLIGTYTNVDGQSVTGTVAGLDSATYYYAALVATNAATNICASPNLYLKTTPDTFELDLETTGVSNVVDVSASLYGALYSIDTNAFVTAYWWETGSVITNDSGVFGIFTNAVNSNFNYAISGTLTPNTEYTFIFRATNLTDSAEAHFPMTFTTPGPPEVDNGIGPAAYFETIATLNGRVTDTNGAPLDTVRIYFGTADGGTIPANWDTSFDMNAASVSEGVTFSTNPPSAVHGQTYYYTVYASNIYGDVWSTVTNFTTWSGGTTSVGGSTTINAGDNAWVYKGASNTDQDETLNLRVYDEGSDGNTRLAYLRFDISGLSVGVNDLVYLDLYADWHDSTAARQLVVAALNDGVASETTWGIDMTYNTRPDGTSDLPNGNTTALVTYDGRVMKETAGSGGPRNQENPPGQFAIVIDPTTFQAILDADTNNELTLILYGTSATMNIASLGGGNFEPQLRIVRSGAVQSIEESVYGGGIDGNSNWDDGTTTAAVGEYSNQENQILVFELPEKPEGGFKAEETTLEISLSAHNTCTACWGQPMADIWGIGYVASNAIPLLEADVDNYINNSDTESRTGWNTGGDNTVKIYNNMVTPWSSAGGRYGIPPEGCAILTDFINNLYDTHGAVKGDYLILRVSHDVNPDPNDRFNFYTGNAAEGVKPVLTLSGAASGGTLFFFK